MEKLLKLFKRQITEKPHSAISVVGGRQLCSSCQVLGIFFLLNFFFFFGRNKQAAYLNYSNGEYNEQLLKKFGKPKKKSKEKKKWIQPKVWSPKALLSFSVSFLFCCVFLGWITARTRTHTHTRTHARNNSKIAARSCWYILYMSNDGFLNNKLCSIL